MQEVISEQEYKNLSKIVMAKIIGTINSSFPESGYISDAFLCCYEDENTFVHLDDNGETVRSKTPEVDFVTNVIHLSEELGIDIALVMDVVENGKEVTVVTEMDIIILTSCLMKAVEEMGYND